MEEEPSSQISPESRNISDLLRVVEEQVSTYQDTWNKLTDVEKQKIGDSIMAEVMTPSMIMGAGSNDGILGGNGLIGGLVLGALLRNNGGFLGNEGAAGAVLRSPPEQNQANMSLMAAIAGVDKSVAVSTTAMEASQAQQSAGIVSQLNAVTGSLATRVEGVKDVVNSNAMVLAQQLNGLEKSTMENRYELSKDIQNDGDKTRALITQQYEATLNRQLGEANAALIELRTQNLLAERTRSIEVNTTNTVNQSQQQQQQQQQFGQLANLIWGLSQQIRSTNEAINVGSGTLTASPTNTNTNIR